MEVMKRYMLLVNRPELNTTFIFKRCKSGAFAYGNGTCVLVKRADGYSEVYDTRYDTLVISDFTAWCENWFDNNINPELNPLYIEF